MHKEIICITFKEKVLTAMRASVIANVPLMSQILFVPLLILVIGVYENPQELQKQKSVHHKFLATHIETIKT